MKKKIRTRLRWGGGVEGGEENERGEKERKKGRVRGGDVGQGIQNDRKKMTAAGPHTNNAFPDWSQRRDREIKRMGKLNGDWDEPEKKSYFVCKKKNPLSFIFDQRYTVGKIFSRGLGLNLLQNQNFPKQNFLRDQNILRNQNFPNQNFLRDQNLRDPFEF